MKKHTGLLASGLVAAGSAFAGNPMVPDVGMADPHIRIFDGKAYLYATRDRDKDAKKFTMPDWHIWSSDDLIRWKHETTILPTETYMGESIRCWATDCVAKNGKYYFYFSNGNTDMGVMVADSPTGPFKDALGKPMMAEDMMPTKEYDPSVLIDDDGSAYIIVGHHRDRGDDHYYAIAQLNEDMISLAEEPKEVKIMGKVKVLAGNDKPTLHKKNGLYYLSAGSHYATSENIYGPYVKRGNSGGMAHTNAEKYGLSGRAHGNYFDWNNQSFHTWCHFHLGKDVARYRESYISYLHYKENGEMVTDTAFLDAHFSTGVGQYDAGWENIEAEWYMAAEGVRKIDLGTDGFQVVFTRPGSFLNFPNVDHVPAHSRVAMRVASNKGGKFEIREGATDGPLLGTGAVKPTGGADQFKEITVSLKNSLGKNNLFVVLVDGEIALDRFRFVKVK